MGAFDPVPWAAVEAAVGPPAGDIPATVEEFAADVADRPPYEAVKTIHDALDAADRDRGGVPSAGEPFLTAYLLERRGAIEPGETYPSLVARKPDPTRLRALVHERERTLWWIGVLAGVHPALVTYWCYEADVPLLERNFAPASLAAIRD